MGVGESCSIQHEITFVTLFWLLYLIKLTKLLNAHEGARKRFSGRWEANCTKLAGSFKYSRGSLHWKHLNNRRLKGFDMILRKNSTNLSTYKASTLALMDGSVYANMDNIGGNSHNINSILNIIVVEIKAIFCWKIQAFWLL